MKILFIHTFYKLPGGEDSVVQNEMAMLRENGHEVALLSFSNNGTGALKLLLMPYNPFSYRATKEKLKEFAPDIVHIHNLHFAATMSVIYAIRRAKVPMVMTIHNYRLLCPSASLFHNNELFLDSLETVFPWSAVRKGVYKDSKLITFWLACSSYLHRKLGTWQLIDRFIFLNEHSMQLFLNSTFEVEESRTAIKPNFVLATATVQNPALSSYFLYVGRLTVEKGIMALLDAFAGSGIWLKIAGMGPLDSVVESYARENNNIEYLGQQSREKIDSLLEKAEAVIFPSLWFETFGMIVIEAFVKGIPVIASDLGNMKVLVSDGFNGSTFNPGDAKHLRDKVKAFQSLPTVVKKKMRANARVTYELNFSSERNLIKLVQIYHSSIC
ncbi:MAG: glycosyltransferase [Phormidesmis sp. FL-bin-119]|nr:glycosyltransferase [Pedobacter sp.]